MKSEVLRTDVHPLFSKVLSKYYLRWFHDSQVSVQYCREREDWMRAQEYANDAALYKELIIQHWDAIEFFSEGSNAFKYDWALPEEFRGYK